MNYGVESQKKRTDMVNQKEITDFLASKKVPFKSLSSLVKVIVKCYGAVDVDVALLDTTYDKVVVLEIGDGAINKKDMARRAHREDTMFNAIEQSKDLITLMKHAVIRHL